jgi:hypothetical protein
MRHALIAFAALVLPGAVGAAGPEWQSEYAAAREAARRDGKPLFVVFRCVP